MVSSIGSATDTSASANAAASKATLGQKDFLRLMVAQVKNQDPMQPQQNGEFLSQLAQFSASDGIAKMQASIEQLATSLQSNQALQASALVGRKVLVDSNVMNLGESGEAKASIEAVAGLSNLTASITSEAGELIKTIPLGQANPGLFEFAWDGTNEAGERAPAGKYKIAVNGVFQGQEVSIRTLSAANVDSVSLGSNGEGLKLNVAGIGPVSLENVRQITV